MNADLKGYWLDSESRRVTIKVPLSKEPNS